VIDQFELLPTALDAGIRKYVAHNCRFPDVLAEDVWAIQGTKVSFYKDTWLCYLQRVRINSGGPGVPLYFLAQTSARRKVSHIVPVANHTGAVDRVNRELRLNLNRKNLIDYLHFYYAFTPKVDPVAPLSSGPTQFRVPRTTEDLSFNAAAATDLGPRFTCGTECLALGAVWHFLDERQHALFAPLRFKRKTIGYFRVTARVVVQFENALFAVDVKVPEVSGAPVLSNPELLFQGGLKHRDGLPNVTIPMPNSIRIRETLRDLWKQIGDLAGRFMQVAGLVVSWAFTLLFGYLWGLTALFPIFEILGLRTLRTHLEWLSGTIGHAGWATTLLELTVLALAAFLSMVFYLTNMDRIFNWIFALLPKGLEDWLASLFNPRIDKRDRDLIAIDTFRKRAWMALRLLAGWTTYAVLAFASIQIAVNVMQGAQSASAFQIVWSLGKQAALNIPIVVYAMLRMPWLFGGIRPVEEGILDPSLLLLFHGIMAIVIVKGILRIWLFTKEATPRAFYRRLRYHK
jgi:hypothetical protein